MNNKKEKIIIVDENDEQIGVKERGVLNSGDIYRVSALWVTNSENNILLSQRKFNKEKNPGKWGPAVAGTNNDGETYLTNILKETKEEIGIDNIKVKQWFKVFKKGERIKFMQWYLAEMDKDIKEFEIQQEEVEQIKWFTVDELKYELKVNPDKFLDTLPEIFEKYLKI